MTVNERWLVSGVLSVSALVSSFFWTRLRDTHAGELAVATKLPALDAHDDPRQTEPWGGEQLRSRRKADVRRPDDAPKDSELVEESYDDDSHVDEDEEAALLDNRPEQIAWRLTYRSERHDPAWTKLMREELGQRLLLVSAEAGIGQLDCRETICRMFLNFSDIEEANAFQEVSGAPGLEYEYQDLNPSGREADKWGTTYEVLVRRERPQGLQLDDLRMGTSEYGEDPSVVAPVTEAGGTNH